MRGSKKEKTLCNKPRQRLDFMCLHAYMKKKRTTRSGNTFSFVPVMLFPLFVRACVCECVCARVCACARTRVFGGSCGGRGGGGGVIRLRTGP